MNIYLVERMDGVDYDEYDSFVCYAENSITAKKVIPYCGDEKWRGSSSWVPEDKKTSLKITRLGKAGNEITEEKIILSSYNAG